jgi:hypothetical protein
MCQNQKLNISKNSNFKKLKAQKSISVSDRLVNSLKRKEDKT